MEDYDKKRKFLMKNANIPIELVGFKLHNEESKDRRQLINKHVDIQTEQTACTSDDQQTNYWQHMNTNQVVVPMKDSKDTLDDSRTKNPRVVETTSNRPNLIITNIDNDNKADFKPLEGYAKEPLLLLEEACAPLMNILHNLSFYIQMVLKETPVEPSDGLTIDESAAIRLYTTEWNSPHRSLYSMLNYTLNNGDREHLQPYFKYIKLLLTALVKLPCVPQSTVWRGVTKNMSAQFPPGTPVTWWAFSSCTTTLTTLENNMYLGNTGDRTLFSVEVINGRAVRNHSCFVTEDEILLLPGTHMIVQSQLSPAPDLQIIHLKQIIPKEVLLEPPFEGISNIFNHLFKLISFSYSDASLYPIIE
jgi:hypothetical protein